MRLRTLRLDRIGACWLHLLPLPCSSGARGFAPAKQSGFRKSGISVSAPQFRQLIFQNG